MSKQKTLLLRNRNQVTLPKEMLIEGVHEYEYEKLSDGTFRLIPLTAIPLSQRYFWTERWQKGELQASEDLRAGRYKDYDDVEELIRDLNSGRKSSRLKKAR